MFDANKYKREWHQNNHERARASQKASKHRRQAELKQIYKDAKNKPCADCGIQYAYWIMQFDHIKDKVFAIPRMIANAVTIGRFLAEISKCEVVCANCHANRTFERRQYVKRSEVR